MIRLSGRLKMMMYFFMIDKRDEALVRKIIQYCEDIDLTMQRFGKTKHIFQNDLVYRNACALCILQIGELANHISAKRRENATYSMETGPWYAQCGGTCIWHN